VKRTHRKINRLWRLFCGSKHEDWSKYFKDLVLMLNYTVSDTLRLAPAQTHLNVRTLILMMKKLGLLEDNREWNLNEWDENVGYDQ